jgi:hypothetical protein
VNGCGGDEWGSRRMTAKSDGGPNRNNVSMGVANHCRRRDCSQADLWRQTTWKEAPTGDAESFKT